MDALERKALYNSLRMNWMIDPALKVEPWQVEDYRALPMEALFKRLEKFQIVLGKISFTAYAENCNTPEEFTDSLIGEEPLEAAEQDQIYLLVFELWRRLIPEKVSLSILCDEIDHLIYLYDLDKLENPEILQDALALFVTILDENTDSGENPQEVFSVICKGCANDLEEFLYDYIETQIEEKNYPYASELLDGFTRYFLDPKWFDCLRVRLLALSGKEKEGKEEASLAMRKLMKKALEEQDFDFNLELLELMVKAGERGSFIQLVKQSLPLIELEEDFQDLLRVCSDYMLYLDRDAEQKQIESIIAARASLDNEKAVNLQDPHLQQLLAIIEFKY
jgi:hypothetical protein